MFKSKFVTSLILAALLIIPSFSYASVGVSVDGTNQGATEHLNLVVGGTTTAKSGQNFNIPIAANGLIVAGTANGGATSMASSDTAVPVSYSYVRKSINTNGSDPLYIVGTMANGVAGQTLTIFITEGTGPWTLTPTTKTGFTSVTFNAAKQSATFLFVDTTIGWVLLSTGSSASVALPTVNIP